jgi:hypothetical protein
MSDSYEECLDGYNVTRPAPGRRHELVCRRLHEIVLSSVGNLTSTRLLAPRSPVRVSASTQVCPDLALTTVAGGKLWLAAEIISSEDHRVDTVIKKDLYEALKIPRLWMIDTRYDNVEVYHSTAYGLTLKEILAGREILSEKLLPEFQLTVSDIFKVPQPQN